MFDRQMKTYAKKYANIQRCIVVLLQHYYG